MAAKAQDAKEQAEALSKDEKALSELVEVLAAGSRRERQQAAATIAQVSRAHAEALIPHANALVDALNRPEGGSGRLDRACPLRVADVRQGHRGR